MDYRPKHYKASRRKKNQKNKQNFVEKDIVLNIKYSVKLMI